MIELCPGRVFFRFHGDILRVLQMRGQGRGLDEQFEAFQTPITLNGLR